MKPGKLCRGIQVLLLCTVATLALSQQKGAVPENQPHMTAALEHLRQAQRELQAGSHDKGGHRVAALRLVEQAEAEVNKGIQYDNIHPEQDQKRMKKH